MNSLRILAAVAWLAMAGSAAAEVSAAVVQRTHPVLIRNDHNELLELVIQVSGGGPVRLQSVTCSLTVTDSLDDIASVELLATGADAAFRAGRSFGGEQRAARTITFTGDDSLAEGPNRYWLSARLSPRAALSNKIAASCSELRTSQGVVAVRTESAPLRRRIGVALRKSGEDATHTYRIPALATSARGSLLAVYDMRRRLSRDLQEDIDIGLSRSTDGGRTWEPPRVIMDMGQYGGLPEELNGCSDPGIVVDRTTGEIFVFAVWMWGKGGKHQWRDDGSEPGFEIGKTAQLLMTRSRDDGRSWSKPENLTRQLKQEDWWLLAPSPQQGLQLADGTLVMPMQGRDEKGVPFATIMVSKDHGASWTLGAPAHSRGNECQAAVLGDGSIMLNIRNGGVGYRAVYVTKDLGQTWTPHETHANTLIEPTCNASLYRFGEGRDAVLLFANPRAPKARTHHTIQASLDDGRTWPDRFHLLLDEGRGRGYPSITRIDANHFGIVYEGSRADLAFEKIHISELLRGAEAKGARQ